MVSFRLSEGEYAEMLEVCRSRGYRNLSHFALSALRSFSSDNASGGPRFEPNELRRRIDELAVELNRLSESVQFGSPGQCAACGASLPRPVTGKATPVGA